MTTTTPPKKRTVKKVAEVEEKTQGPDGAIRFERFCAKFLRHIKGQWAGQPFILEPWQRDEIVKPLFTLGPDGLRQYREAMIGLPRKNGKSELAAALGLYMLIADGEFGAEVYSLAGSRPQAGIVFRTARDMLRASPLRSAAKIYRDAIEIPETNSIYKVLSSDSKLAHGYNPSAAIVDELHVHPDGELYEAMRTATAARRQPLIVSITTAGAERRGIAWDVYERGRSGKDPRMFFYWKQAPESEDVFDIKNAKLGNPASWVSEQFLKDQMPPSLPEPVFRRLHLNQWWEGENSSWISREVWMKCLGDPEIDPEKPVVIAVDAASRRDTTAVALVQRDDEGKHHAKLWHFGVDDDEDYLDYGAVEELIRELASTYEVRRIAFDPFQMVRTAQILDTEGLPVETFPQNDVRMVPASQLLYDLIVEGNLVVPVDDQIATDQVLAAGIVETARGWRLHKKKSSRAIDSTIALAMGVQLAEWEHNLGDGPRVFVI